MRVLSLLPAATEWIAAFGASECLVGRSHACDHPPSVTSLPVVTSTAVPANATSAAIQGQVQDRLQQGVSLYTVDLELVRTLQPDLIVTQAQCEACAVSLNQLEADLARWSNGQPELFSLTPLTLKQVLDAALRLGKRLGRTEGAMHDIGARERRLQEYRQAVDLERPSSRESLPRVVCIEWLDPLMTAGHWMPDVVEQAGGRSVLAELGQPSTRVDWEAVCAEDPDVLAIMPCGFTIEQTLRDLHLLTERAGWEDLTAVRSGRVFVFDGNAYFNRPGPRLYRAIELLGTMLHPVAARNWDLSPESWERRTLPG